MSLFHIFVILTLSLVFILAVIMTFYYKGKLRHNSEMVLSMGIGTNIGLTAGLLIGAIYQGNLFYSTVYSIRYSCREYLWIYFRDPSLT